MDDEEQWERQMEFRPPTMMNKFFRIIFGAARLAVARLEGRLTAEETAKMRRQFISDVYRYGPTEAAKKFKGRIRSQDRGTAPLQTP